ncbi:hypothetical protein MBLNU457_4975t1 [Dothideomycetes sp. NU457]
MDRKIGAMTMLQKEFLMGFHDLPEFIKSFKIDRINQMRMEFGRLDPKAVCIHAPLRSFIDDFFERLLQRTELYGNCGPSREQKDMFISVMVEKVYKECERNVKRTATGRSSKVAASIARHDGATPAWSHVSYTNESQPRRNAVAPFSHTTRTHEQYIPNVTPEVSRLASPPPLRDTTNVWVDIRYEKSTWTHAAPLSSCLTLHKLYRKIYPDPEASNRRIFAEFRNRSLTPYTRYDISICNPNKDAEWDGMIRIVCRQPRWIDTTIVVLIEGQEPDKGTNTDGSHPRSPSYYPQSPDLSRFTQDVSGSTSSSS